ncbi:MAG: hypothetical protein ACOCZK_04410, partial [Planctomycetota bacterium]
PLNTMVPCTDPLPEQPASIRATVRIPAGAPADLGAGAYLVDRHGKRFESVHPQPLNPGEHRLVFPIAEQPLQAVDHHGGWSATAAALTHGAGLFFWSSSGSDARVTVSELQVTGKRAIPAPADHRLADLQLRNLADGRVAIATGERWTLTCIPQPSPHLPHHRERFTLQAVFTHQDGGPTETIAGFYREPHSFHDRGDTEVATASAPGHFELRWRPRRPGQYTARLEACWNQQTTVRLPLPPITVTGAIWDDYVRVDTADPRFFSTGQATGTTRFYWPIGLNLRSTWDLRGARRTDSRITPDRGMYAYRAYIDRFAANGGNAIEVWMASWNLALEWRADWPGYHGIGRYNQANAERLDALLDHCWRRGVRVNLVIRNHGQGSHKTDAEWADNPWNAKLRQSPDADPVAPGPIASTSDFFTDARALAGQERLRRYIIARYADHPAILGWKLWSEMNLTGAGRAELRDWHAQACRRWHALDPYGHPVTSHWSGNYRTPDRSLVAIDGDAGLDYVCIDAYHGGGGGEGILLAQLLWQGTLEPGAGLARHGKPVLVTEYGGNWNACPEPQLIAEHRSGPWAALTSGYGGGPMLWWFEWVDQGGRWAPYRALAAFLTGEDLRSHPSSTARAVHLDLTIADRPVWAQLWCRPGRILGYLLDERWGRSGGAAPPLRDGRCVIGTNIGSGAMTVEWWDAEAGTMLSQHSWQHPGGELALAIPTFRRHLAFKLLRQDDTDTAAPGAGEG